MSNLPRPVSWILRTTLILVIIFVAYNLFKDRNTVKIDQSSAPSSEEIIKKVDADLKSERNGVFSGSGPYQVTGEVSIVTVDGKKLLKFSDNFSSSAGPDLQVYLSKNDSANGLGEFISLNALKNLQGAQVYSVPDDVDNYASVIIWCRGFNVAFGSADLN